MKLCLLSRFFDLRNAGIGRYSMELLKKLRETDLKIETVSQNKEILLREIFTDYSKARGTTIASGIKIFLDLLKQKTGGL